MSRGDDVAGLGSAWDMSGKLRTAEWPLMVRAATSCARAAISGVANVPSQMRDFLRGSRISETHFPQLRFRTPWYTGCLLQSLGLLLGLLLCFWASSVLFVVDVEEEVEDDVVVVVVPVPVPVSEEVEVVVSVIVNC